MKGKRITKNLLFEYLCFDKNIRKGNFADRQKLTACTVEDTVRILLYKILILRNSYFCSFNDAIAPYILKSKSTLASVTVVH